MVLLYTTVNNSSVDFGLAYYAVRDNQIYANINN